jgi:type IV pilus assembly protein PilA
MSMERKSRQKQRGFTQIEIMIVVVIVGVLVAVAISAYRDYQRRATISEVVLATSNCKSIVSESYVTLLEAPDSGAWGCEQASATVKQKYVGYVQTSTDGAIRVSIANLDGLVNGRHVYLIPMHPDGVTRMQTPDDLGRNVTNWVCGSDWLPVRNALPGSCRADTTVFATLTYQ